MERMGEKHEKETETGTITSTVVHFKTRVSDIERELERYRKGIREI